jgi:hypothetical protein
MSEIIRNVCTEDMCVTQKWQKIYMEEYSSSDVICNWKLVSCYSTKENGSHSQSKWNKYFWSLQANYIIFNMTSDELKQDAKPELIDVANCN